MPITATRVIGKYSKEFDGTLPAGTAENYPTGIEGTPNLDYVDCYCFTDFPDVEDPVVTVVADQYRIALKNNGALPAEFTMKFRVNHSTPR